MILGRNRNPDRRVAFAAALILASGALLGSSSAVSTSTEASGLKDGQGQIETASGKVLVPKRVRLVIDFKQTVPA